MPGEPLIYRSHSKLFRIMLAVTLAVEIIVALAGCHEQPKLVVIGCPPVAAYPIEFQHQALAAVRALPADSPLRRYMDDYSKMRDQARKCATS